MNFWNSLSGTYRIEISSASIANTITAVNSAEICLLDVAYVDELTITGRIFTSAYKRLALLLGRRGDTVRIIGKEGLFWTLVALKKRPILLIGVCVFLALALYLPTRVLFVRVEGNSAIPAQAIIEKAEACGIRFGTSRRQVRSEKVKNALLGAMPELKWTGVNTYGCVAVISVRERTIAEQQKDQTGVASIVAKKDGVITEMTVINGTSLCREGQAVKEGQVLVSGYTDCGLSIKAEVADAEIFAQTRHDLHMVTPTNYQKCVLTNPSGRRYYLKIGKKLINFSKDSGISSATCVKMYKENYLLLPGGFQLPIAMVIEELYSRITEPAIEDDYDWLIDYSKKYLSSQMIAGRILQSNFTELGTDDKFTLIGNFACLEMIGQVRYEEIIEGNGKRN